MIGHVASVGQNARQKDSPNGFYGFLENKQLILRMHKLLFLLLLRLQYEYATVSLVWLAERLDVLLYSYCIFSLSDFLSHEHIMTSKHQRNDAMSYCSLRTNELLIIF